MPPTETASQIPGAVPSKPGILFVLSTVLDPNALDPASFADWYENTHIQEVQSTGGISSSQRYEALIFASKFRGRQLSVVPENRNLAFDFATVYHMPDLAFRESEAFRGLDGQTKPRQELLEGLFRRVSFVTRFAAEVGDSSPGSGDSSTSAAPFVVTVASLAGDGGIPELENVKGVRRVKKYKVHEGSLLERFERSWLDEPTEMAILEIESQEGVATVADALAEVEGLEIGYWALRREYAGSERTPKGWSPRSS